MLTQQPHRVVVRIKGKGTWKAFVPKLSFVVVPGNSDDVDPPQHCGDSAKAKSRSKYNPHQSPTLPFCRMDCSSGWIKLRSDNKYHLPAPSMSLKLNTTKVCFLIMQISPWTQTTLQGSCVLCWVHTAGCFVLMVPHSNTRFHNCCSRRGDGSAILTLILKWHMSLPVPFY